MIVTLEEFVEQLEDLGILPDETLQTIISSESVPNDAEELANELVRQKKLTKFQAGQIYLGNAKSLVLDNYVLLERIGSGAMGQVFKARHRRMDRIVAVKQLPAAMTRDVDAIARFEREIKAIARFSHPNIVTAYDADCANGVHFLVMEFIEGCDLSALVKKDGPFSVEKALNYVLQTAKGLNAAHAQGIVHRDIKPANLLLDRNGVVKILDLGIARLNEDIDRSTPADLTSTGMVLGTVEYMAPEQALDSKTADARADIYSLGCSLFYLLTGKSTYDGDTMMKRLVAHREQPIPSISSFRPDIPEPVETIFKKMVAKNVADRYQSMTDVIHALEVCGQALELTLHVPLPLDSPLDIAEIRNLELPNHAPLSATTIPVQTKKMKMQIPSRDRRMVLSIGSGILGLLICLSLLVVTRNAKEGMLIVAVNEPDALVELLNEAGNVEITRVGESGQVAISVGRGKYRLQVSKQGFESFAKDVAGESGRKQQIMVKLIALERQPAVVETKPVSEVPEMKPLAFQTPGFEHWMNDIERLPAEKQLEAVSKKLVELNPGFDGKVTDTSGNESPKIVSGVITELGFAPDHVIDLSPVRGLQGLKELFCFSKRGTGRLSDLTPLKGMPLTALKFANTNVSDLSPLQGMNLVSLSFFATRVADLSPLRGMKLRRLNCALTQVTDLTPLQGMPLNGLYCHETHVADLTPLQGMPLRILDCRFTPVSDLTPLRGLALSTLVFNGSGVTDLSPLRGMELKEVYFSPLEITNGIDVIQQMKSIEAIGLDPGKRSSPEEFWRRYEAGEFGKATTQK